MLRGSVSLPVVALYNAWLAEGLPPLHNALMVEVDFDEDPLGEDDMGSTLSGLAGLAGNGWSELERNGLARDKQVHPDLGRSLRLVAEAGTEYYAFFSQEGGPTRSALVVTSGDDALRVILTPDGKQFVLEPVRARDAAQSLIAALPEVPPGKGGAISLRADALDNKPRHGSDDGGGSFMQRNRPASGPQQQQVEQLRKLLQEKRTGGGQLFVGRRDRFGKKQRCPRPLNFFDTTGGRYLQLSVPGNDGTAWNTVQPADFSTMAGRLQQLTATLQG